MLFDHLLLQVVDDLLLERLRLLNYPLDLAHVLRLQRLIQYSIHLFIGLLYQVLLVVLHKHRRHLQELISNTERLLLQLRTRLRVLMGTFIIFKGSLKFK